MPNSAKSLVLWENNSDTPITSSNLSRALDFSSDSKFIYYTNNHDDYVSWADANINEAWTNYTGNAIAPYVNKTVYNFFDRSAKIGAFDTGYGWIATTSPYLKLLTVKPFTKITMKYVNTSTSEMVYESFDFGEDAQFFSIESMIVDTNFISNAIYNIYLYHHQSYGDNAYFKIVNLTDDINDTNNWKEGEDSISSPSGTSVISYRLVGGFQTGANQEILNDTVWDISVKNTQVISDSYKISSNNEIRNLSAIDIAIQDSSEVYSANNIEEALTEVKVLSNSLREDVYYHNGRYGVELKWTSVKRANNAWTDLTVNEIALKITAGFIDVLGVRIKFIEDIYIANTSIPIKIKSSDGSPTNYGVTPVRVLGQQSSDGSQLWEGLWRCFISSEGKISFKEDATERPTFNSDFKGWYDADGSRCIGKFKISLVGGNKRFIQKPSITPVRDEVIPSNVVYVYHGTMCPDGLLPCDGRWHDVNGVDVNDYATLPITTEWIAGAWYEETPNLWDRTVKMISEPIVPQGQSQLPINVGEFSINRNTSVITGGSADCGVSNDILSKTHVHQHAHTHLAGNLSIQSSGEHTHTSGYNSIYASPTFSRVVDTQTAGVTVSTSTHVHTLNIISSGGHEHASNKFSGATATSSTPSTDSTSTWAPYKEMIFCIKL